MENLKTYKLALVLYLQDSMGLFESQCAVYKYLLVFYIYRRYTRQ